ncbi:Smr/MutS family protein [uncultured Methylobacterium sp.]|uniref:Smr/MutS family protein n=1 Tax=uncultured Methylobacterium sp. TaxID=157278 RepID=UPI0035CBFD6D
MRPPRRPRTLSREEAHLWGEIAKLITPLRGRVTLRKKAAPAAEAPAAAAKTAMAKVSTGKVAVGKVATAKPSPGAVAAGTTVAAPDAGPTPAPPAPPAKKPRRVVRLGASAPPPAPRMPAPLPVTFVPAAPGAPGLERRERQRLSRGLLAIEGRIDLHGLYQAEAHAALVGFLMRARAAGHARVLVVTGKGAEDAYAGRGVLRRSVPHWLRGAELSGLVLGFEEAARHHGGAGALYVRLRRR